MAGIASTARAKAGVLGLVVLLVVAVVAAGLLVKQNADLREGRDVVAAETAATKEAARIAVSMTTYDHRSVEDDFAWIEEDGTSSFRDRFTESSEPIRQLIVRSRATATGTVTDAAGNALDPEHVEVLVFVDQKIQRAGAPRPTVDGNRVVMQMVRQDGRWLVDDVELR